LTKRKAPMSRSEMMSRIGPKNTKPEMIIRKGLHSLGFRYRIHQKCLPGCPDLVLKKHQSVIFIQGCFWHAHYGCRFFRLPKTNTEFWAKKLESNRIRDMNVTNSLLQSGWRVLKIWECAIRVMPINKILELIASWLIGNYKYGNFSEAVIQFNNQT
jgi:DNA mismatch endonuclease (patch repair protein)